MPVYHTVPRRSPVHAGFNVHLSVAFPWESPTPEEETLSIQVTCSNGTLPERFTTHLFHTTLSLASADTLRSLLEL